MRITKFKRESGGYYSARVSEDGVTVNVHNRFGSWLIEEETPEGVVLREIRLQDAKEELARRVRAERRKEGKKVQR